MTHDQLMHLIMRERSDPQLDSEPMRIYSYRLPESLKARIKHVAEGMSSPERKIAEGDIVRAILRAALDRLKD